jgi:hypothetical protein
MAAEFSANAAQDIPANSSAVFTEVKTPCPCGLVILRVGTGLIRLVNNEVQWLPYKTNKVSTDKLTGQVIARIVS